MPTFLRSAARSAQRDQDKSQHFRWRLKMASLFGAFVAGPLWQSPFSSATDFHLPSFCLFKAVTGFNCPACGITRAVALSYQFDFSSSLAMHPAGLLVALLVTSMFIYFFISATLSYRFPVSWDKEIKVMRWSSVVIVTVLLASWPMMISKSIGE